MKNNYYLRKHLKINSHETDSNTEGLVTNVILNTFKVLKINSNYQSVFNYIYIYIAHVWESKVQSHVESYQRLKKWYLMPPCLTLSIIRYGSRVKWINPEKGVVPSLTPQCSSH